MDLKEKLRITQSIAKGLEVITAIPCIAAIGMMTVVVVMGVFFRYVLLQPLSWTEEVSRYLMMWAACLAISIAIQRKEHIGIKFVLNLISSEPRKWITLTSDFTVLIFLVVFTYKAYQMALGSLQQISPIVGIKMVWSIAAVPVGGILCIFQLFLKMIQDMITPTPPPRVSEKAEI